VPENSTAAFSSVFLDKTPPVDAHIDEMIQWGKKIGVKGNLSFRTKMGFITNGCDIAPESITKDNVVEVRGVVFGLNRPSIYAKGQGVPCGETLLHSDIYEALPDINAIICSPCPDVLKAAAKLGLPSTDVEQHGGSLELAQAAGNLVKSDKSVRCFILKNYAVIALGANLAEAGKQMEDILKKSKAG